MRRALDHASKRAFSAGAKLRLRLLCLLTLLLSAANQSLAQDDELFYRLGGGVPIGAGPTNRVNTARIGGSVAWNTDLTCGNFDISTSIENQLNGVTGAFQNMMSNIIDTATGVVASLPALVIQRLNPALYDLLQNGILQASEEFHLAELSCEAIVDQMGQRLETQGWGGIAQGQWWREESQTAGADILDSKDRAETDGPDEGVPWIGGTQAGGAAQDPILVNEDAAIAGMNLMLGRAPDARASVAPSACAGAKICETWTAPDLAAAWLTDVIGDTEIQTCQGCDKVTTRAGMGLQRKYEQDKQVIENALTPLVNSGTNPNQATLDAFEGGEGFAVTRRLIEAIRSESAPAPVIARLSGELALSRTMERALMVRRALLAGMKEPNIANNEMALTALRHSVAELDGEIESMTFELQVRQLLTTNTAVQILSRARLRRNAPVVEPMPSNTLREGAVVQ